MRNQRVGSVLIQSCFLPLLFRSAQDLLFIFLLNFLFTLALFGDVLDKKQNIFLASWIILYLYPLLIVAWPFVVIHSFQPFQVQRTNKIIITSLLFYWSFSNNNNLIVRPIFQLENTSSKTTYQVHSLITNKCQYGNVAHDESFSKFLPYSSCRQKVAGV